MFCSLCKQEAVIYLPYAQRHLCPGHFGEMFEKRFRGTVRDFKMIKKGERVAVGLSGGKDSVTLLHLLHRLQKDLPFELLAITIDEGIAGYRSKTLEIAEQEAKRLGIEHRIFSYKKEIGLTLDEIMEKKKEQKIQYPSDTSSRSSSNSKIPCSYCGVMRRRLLNNAARELHADKLALGHNLDDMAQSVLMNIMRNEPMRLARLNEPLVENEKFVPRIRPLMRTPEKEVAVYALVHDLPIDFQECPYARHAFRAHIREQLNETEERYPGTKFKIVNSFLAMEDALKKGFDKKPTEIRMCTQCGEPAGVKQCMFCTMLSNIKPPPYTIE